MEWLLPNCTPVDESDMEVSGSEVCKLSGFEPAYGLVSGTPVGNERPIDAAVRTLEEFTKLKHGPDFCIVNNCGPFTVYSKEEEETVPQVNRSLLFQVD